MHTTKPGLSYSSCSGNKQKHCPWNPSEVAWKTNNAVLLSLTCCFQEVLRKSLWGLLLGNQLHYIRGCKEFGRGMHMRAQCRNQTRVFLIKDGFPPAAASNALPYSPIILWDPQEMSYADISAGHKSAHVLFTKIYSSVLLFTDLFSDKRMSLFFHFSCFWEKLPLMFCFFCL